MKPPPTDHLNGGVFFDKDPPIEVSIFKVPVFWIGFICGATSLAIVVLTFKALLT